MREVAERAGVAMSSVSRVLSEHPDVSPVMRERVRRAVEELGYKPDILAQSLRRRTTHSVGFVVGDISNQLYADIVKGAETALREGGYSMLLTNSEGDPDLDTAHVRLFEQRRTDGLILSLAREDHRATIEALEAVDTPIVLVDRDLPPSIAVSRVVSDHARGMHAALGHLFTLGHRRIGLTLGQPIRPARERRLAFEAAHAMRGLEPGPIVAGRFSVDFGTEATARLLDSDDPPTAIVAGGNQLMIGALRVFSERKLELGRDISFVACDDIPIAGLYRPPIAVIRRDAVGLGRTAAQLLLSRLGGGDVAGEIVLPTEFVARPSCGPPRI
jgi:LacI family transcriptional regulator, galactose operon repressor